MSDHTALNPAQPPPTKAPSLTDAEANRQFGQGQAPQQRQGVPEAGQAPELSGAHPDTGTPRSDAQTVKVGARDVVRPGQQDDHEGGGDGGLYDRLAKKDTVPSGPGGAKSSIG